MYPTSKLYKQAIYSATREFSLEILVQTGTTTFTLTDANVIKGSFKLNNKSVSRTDFEIGTVIMKDLQFLILDNDGVFSVEDLKLATLKPVISVKLSDDTYEDVPLGTFIIDTSERQGYNIQIKALDQMLDLAKPLSEVPIVYPTTAFLMYQYICDACSITPGTSEFLNGDYTIERPTVDITCRDAIGLLGQMSCTFATMDRYNKLCMVSYASTASASLSPGNRKSFNPQQAPVQFTGVQIQGSSTSTNTLVGTSDYVLSLKGNIFLTHDVPAVLQILLQTLQQIVYYPFSCQYFGDPSIDIGDRIILTHRDGTQYSSIVTNHVYTYRGVSTLEGRGRLGQVTNLGTLTPKDVQTLVAITQQIVRTTKQDLDDFTQVTVENTQLLQNALGGYVYKTNSALYIMDAETLEESVKLWVWNMSGLGYSENGVEGPYTTAITMDGKINASLIGFGQMHGRFIEAGTIEAEALSVECNQKLDRRYVGQEQYASSFVVLPQIIQAEFTKISYSNVIMNSDCSNIDTFNGWYLPYNHPIILPDAREVFLCKNIIQANPSPTNGQFYMSQELALSLDKEYSLSGYVHANNLCVDNAGVSYEGTVYIRIVETANTSNVLAELLYNIQEDDYHFYKTSFIASVTSATLQIVCNYNTSKGLQTSSALTLKVADLILNLGATNVSWTLNTNELHNTLLKADSSGLSVGDSTTPYNTKITPQSFDVYRGRERRISVGESTQLNKTEIMDDLTVGPIKFIVRPNGCDICYMGG